MLATEVRPQELIPSTQVTELEPQPAETAPLTEIERATFDETVEDLEKLPANTVEQLQATPARKEFTVSEGRIQGFKR